MRSPEISLELDNVSLLVEWKSGVIYENQVGGNICYRARIEGVLSPLDISDDIARTIESLPYQSGGMGISIEIGREVDRLLQSDRRTNFISVDFSRIHESWEAWIHVVVNSAMKEETPAFVPTVMNRSYFGPVYGFGRVHGVLTWMNSD